MIAANAHVFKVGVGNATVVVLNLAIVFRAKLSAATA